MKIIQICEFSSGICGVWSRVLHESKELIRKGHEVIVFSSNVKKGSGELVSDYELKDKINIYRFPNNTNLFDKLLSKNVTHFDFEKKLIDINPDIVITHLIHPHSFKALKICKSLGKPCLLVTHAPFNVPRSFPLNMVTWFYYKIKKSDLSGFNSIIAITNWEIPYLISLGVSKEKIISIPNAIPDKFFNEKIKRFNGKNILFFGRVAPIKNIEILVSAFNKISGNYPSLKLGITGPVEKGYEDIKHLVSDRVFFNKTVHGVEEKISVLQDCDIFVLPSKREGLPISLIESMGLGKIVISSKTDGGKEVINDGVNGFLFDTNDSDSLTSKIEQVLKMKTNELTKIQKNARIRALNFKSKNIIDKLNNLILSYSK